MRNTSGFYVSRQAQYYSGESVVEVESNGLDYSGPDMLVPKYSGEGESYADPREAVEAAIEICRLWRKDGERKAHVAVGTTGGFGMEIEPDTFKGARQWAKAHYESLPKCDVCGDIIAGEKWHLTDDPDYGEFCTESCCDRAYTAYCEDNSIGEESEE